MGLISFIKGFFEESEEELLEDIKEANKQKKEAERKLKELKKRKKSKKKIKPMPLRYKVIIGVSLFIILAVAFGMSQRKDTYKFICNDKHPCTDCDVVVLCPQFEETGNDEHYFHFLVENRKQEICMASAAISIEKEGEIIHNRTVDLKEIKANSEAHFRVQIPLPDGTSDTSVSVTCNKN